MTIKYEVIETSKQFYESKTNGKSRYGFHLMDWENLTPGHSIRVEWEDAKDEAALRELARKQRALPTYARTKSRKLDYKISIKNYPLNGTTATEIARIK